MFFLIKEVTLCDLWFHENDDVKMFYEPPAILNRMILYHTILLTSRF